MAGYRVRIGTGALAIALAGLPAAAAAQGGYGAVPNVPLATGQGWTGRNWTGPMDGPDMRRLPADDRRAPPGDRAVAPPLRAEPPMLAGRPPRPLPPLRADGPATAAYTGRYVRPYRGWTMPTYFASPAFVVRDFPAWGFAPPGPGRQWIRYYDDALLVRPDGRVDDVRYGIDWQRRGPMRMAGRDDGPREGPMTGRIDDRAYDDGYDDGYADARDDGPDRPYDDRPYDDRMHGDGGYGDGRYPGGVMVHHGGYAPGTVIVTTTPGTITTTTTTTEDVVTTAAPRRWRPAARESWSAPARRWSK